MRIRVSVQEAAAAFPLSRSLSLFVSNCVVRISFATKNSYHARDIVDIVCKIESTRPREGEPVPALRVRQKNRRSLWKNLQKLGYVHS